MPDDSGDGDEPTTYTITVEGLEAQDFAVILAGLGEFGERCALTGLQPGVNHAGLLTEKLLVENPDAAREALVDDNVAKFLTAVGISADTLDELGIEVVDGEMVRAVDDDAVDIEVE